MTVYLNDIQAGMEEGFAMGQAASQAFGGGNQYKTDLAGYIFGTGGDQTAAQGHLAGTFNHGTLSGTKDDIRVYCDETRYQAVSDDDKRARDSDNRVVIHAFDVGSSPCDGLFSTTSAYTTQFRLTQWSIIQFCPRYLQAVKIAKYKGIKGAGNKFFNVIGTAVENALTKAQRTTIDLYALFSTTCLHEIMHTTVMGQADDVGSGGGYGWKKIVALGAAGSGSRNADSLAYMGLGTTIIDEDNKFITQGGQLKDIPTASKRDVNALIEAMRDGRMRVARTWKA
ncbi:MAG: hypothetical protein M4579_003465 [Chaenotheca gracillima]|nr:MAG: hypothetical protein M4579_003465 [Chaenotheca gracillima]